MVSFWLDNPNILLNKNYIVELWPNNDFDLERKSIRNNIGANGLTVVINTLFQLITVPILLTNWGVELYGDWLILISLTAYFAM